MNIGGVKNGKPLLFSVTKKDFERQVFFAGGNGGQNQNKNATGVRLIHKDSGARGEARDSKSQVENEKAAFRRLLETKEWKSWHRLMMFELTSKKTIDQIVDEQMDPKHLVVEVKQEGRWVSEPT